LRSVLFGRDEIEEDDGADLLVGGRKQIDAKIRIEILEARRLESFQRGPCAEVEDPADRAAILGTGEMPSEASDHEQCELVADKGDVVIEMKEPGQVPNCPVGQLNRDRLGKRWILGECDEGVRVLGPRDQIEQRLIDASLLKFGENEFLELRARALEEVSDKIGGVFAGEPMLEQIPIKTGSPANRLDPLPKGGKLRIVGVAEWSVRRDRR